VPVKLAAVAVCGLVLGGWAIPLGFLLEVPAPLIYVAAALGGILGCWGLLFLADRIATWWHRWRGTDAAPAAAGAPGPAGRVRVLIDRWGAKGVGLVGPIFPGVTASVLAGTAAGLDRRALARWMTVGIAVMYGLYVIGAWVLLQVL
jgi:hypothetical protein